jgi:hypothetical protein
VFSQNWKNRNGDVSAGSSQTAPASVFPNFTPLVVVTSGITRPCTFRPRMRRISSMPAVMFPHWSLPPICSVQPSRSESTMKSYACSSM